MLDITQAVTILVALSLTSMLLLIGYQVIMILKGIRISVDKTNQILDNANRVSESIAEPIINLSGLLTGLKGGAQLISLFTKGKSKKTEEE